MIVDFEKFSFERPVIGIEDCPYDAVVCHELIDKCSGIERRNEGFEVG